MRTTTRVSSHPGPTQSPHAREELCLDGFAGVLLKTCKQVVTGSSDVVCNSPCSPWTLCVNGVEDPHMTIVSNITV